MNSSKLLSREEVKKLLPDRNLKAWCKDHELYYSGVVRFLKGGTISINGYTNILAAVGVGEECKHWLGEKITYSDFEHLPILIEQASL